MIIQRSTRQPQSYRCHTGVWDQITGWTTRSVSSGHSWFHSYCRWINGGVFNLNRLSLPELVEELTYHEGILRYTGLCRPDLHGSGSTQATTNLNKISPALVELYFILFYFILFYVNYATRLAISSGWSYVIPSLAAIMYVLSASLRGNSIKIELFSTQLNVKHLQELFITVPNRPLHLQY